jgi:hypothetical protein
MVAGAVEHPNLFQIVCVYGHSHQRHLDSNARRISPR